ncbi:MAG: MBL fold metallo-hydrolase [Alphaproteobacteria bacterium]|nr:MBL fold metallo-hydrolase [Alphaproteobacteria bacterium]
MIQARLGYRRLSRIFLTHAHLDHMLGLAGLVDSLAEGAAVKTLTLYGGGEAIELAKRLIQDVVLPEIDQRLAVRLERIEAGVTVACNTVRVLPVPVRHRGGSSLGFLFEEPANRPFDAARAHALGIGPGPDRHRLREGQDVRRPDGRIVVPEDVLGPPVPGTRLLVIGNVAEIESLLPFGKGVDGHVIEAAFLSHERDKAHESGHLVAADSARLARDSGVGTLILTHISARYAGPEILAEARPIFPAAQLASDFARFKIVKASAA